MAKKRILRKKPSSESQGKAKTRLPTSEGAIPQDTHLPVVQLRVGRGSPGRGAGEGCHYWHILYGEMKVGNVFINRITEAPFGLHASIQIKINKSHQGRGIGKIAYKLACEASVHDMVIAHMRKSNIASRTAAKAAGFKAVEDKKIPQLSMKWERGK